MADLIGRIHGEEPAQLARGLRVCTVLALGHDVGRGRQAARFAPPLERKGCAVVTQQLSVQLP
jgi:hypothetical protein